MGRRFAVVVARFNETITGGLLRGALASLSEAGVGPDAVTVVWVPGAYEIPLAALKLAASGRFDAVITLGCLIKGDTMHFEYIASAVSHGIMDVMTATRVPVTFGVLTTLTDEQAEIRAMDGPGNKGREAAEAALAMVSLAQQLEQAAP